MWSLYQGPGTQMVLHCNFCSLHALEPVLPNKRSHINEKHCMSQLESSPHALQLEERLHSNKATVQPKKSQRFQE